MMNLIYGEEASKNIKQQYYDLSPQLGRLVENVVYDTFWSRPGLSMKEKSLVTIISLIALNKQEQLQRYLACYSNLGGELGDMMHCLAYMKACHYASLSVNFFAGLNRFLDGSVFQLQEQVSSVTLSARDKAIIDFSVCIALGDQSQTKKCLINILGLNLLSVDEIESIMLHQIIYCGFPCAMNGFAVLKEIGEKSDDEVVGNPKKSEMMDALYGEAMSKAVYKRCHELSPVFNKLVQEVVYDVFWRRPGVALAQKSLVTIVTLATLKKEEQLRIHLHGYMHQGKTPDIIRGIFSYMEQCLYIDSSDIANSILNEIIKEDSFGANSHASVLIKGVDKAIIDLTACVAIGDKGKIKVGINNLLNASFSREEIEDIMLHAMMYCGLPCALLGFSELKKLSFEASPTS